MDEATRISLKDQFNSLLVRAIEGRRGGMALMRVLEELDFYNSPASAKHHLNVPGGLVLHSLNVARAALELCDKMGDGAKLGSLFDGIGGFPLVWETTYGTGTARWASEIEEFPIAVTKKHFPERKEYEN